MKERAMVSSVYRLETRPPGLAATVAGMVAIMLSGSLLASDDHAGVIYRIT